VPVGTVTRYKVVRCKTCGKIIHRFDRSEYPGWHVSVDDIMKFNRRHYKKWHPKLFAKQIKSGVAKRKAMRKNKLVMVKVPWYKKPLLGVLNPTYKHQYVKLFASPKTAERYINKHTWEDIRKVKVIEFGSDAAFAIEVEGKYVRTDGTIR